MRRRCHLFLATSRLSRAPAFTLIELLVVVAIVGLLAMLAFPALGRARKAAMQATCVSNMRQIGLGLFGYAQDNNNYLPAVSLEWPPANHVQMWPFMVWPYTGYTASSFVAPVNDPTLQPGARGQNIFRCPANFAGFVNAPTAAPPNVGAYSYGLNCGPAGNVPTNPIPLARVSNPSRIVMVSEDSGTLGNGVGYFLYFGLVPHNGGANFLFFDGHVQYMSFTNAYKTYGDTNVWGG